MPHVVALDQIRNDATHARPDPKSMTTHPCCNNETGMRRHAINNGNRIGHKVNHAGPTLLETNRLHLRKKPLEPALD